MAIITKRTCLNRVWRFRVLLLRLLLFLLLQNTQAAQRRDVRLGLQARGAKGVSPRGGLCVWIAE